MSNTQAQTLKLLPISYRIEARRQSVSCAPYLPRVSMIVGISGRSHSSLRNLRTQNLKPRIRRAAAQSPTELSHKRNQQLNGARNCIGRARQGARLRTRRKMIHRCKGKQKRSRRSRRMWETPKNETATALVPQRARSRGTVCMYFVLYSLSRQGIYVKSRPGVYFVSLTVESAALLLTLQWQRCFFTIKKSHYATIST